MHTLPVDQQMIRELARVARHCNVFPIFLPREYFRVTGERETPVGRVLKTLVPEVANYIDMLQDHEFESFIAAMPPGLTFMLGQNPDRSTTRNRERIAVYYLASEIQRVYLSFADVVAVKRSNSEILKTYPELYACFDKDDLLHLDDRFTLHDGGIQYRDHILHYHQFLRRGYTSNPNFDFLGPFINFCRLTSSKNRFRIAVDHLRLMPLEAYLRLMECDTWFGPSFDRKKLDDPSAVGLTIVKRNPSSLFGLTNNLERTEFYWSYRDGVKTLEIEEVSHHAYQFEQYNLNRYLHAERDIHKKVLQHTDGAVKVYLHDQYDQRFSSNMPREAKSYTKVKLWRIDGDIDIDAWLDLTGLFFKGNEMVLEYFDPAKFLEVFEERVRDFDAWKAKQSGSEDSTERMDEENS